MHDVHPGQCGLAVRATRHGQVPHHPPSRAPGWAALGMRHDSCTHQLRLVLPVQLEHLLLEALALADLVGQGPQQLRMGGWGRGRVVGGWG